MVRSEDGSVGQEQEDSGERKLPGDDLNFRLRKCPPIAPAKSA